VLHQNAVWHAACRKIFMHLRLVTKTILILCLCTILPGIQKAWANAPTRIENNLDSASACLKFTKQKELEHGLPNGLLTSISRVESGRIHGSEGLLAWPWTVNHNGTGLFFDSKDQMISYVEEQVRRGDTRIDVGCMQINLFWHARHFESLASMVDPKNNVEYAANFIKKLKFRHGSLNKAVQHYHNADPERNIPYLEKVLALWSPQSKKTTARAESIKDVRSTQNTERNKNIITSAEKHQNNPYGKIITKNVTNADPLAQIKSKQPNLAGRWEQVLKFRELLALKLNS
jgi:hypothetical protein